MVKPKSKKELLDAQRTLDATGPLDFTKTGFIQRLMDAGWSRKEATEEWKRIQL